ncbi:hypothetical protein [Jeotgalibacillus soli]|uniref:Uncharacterized protein n=1 Tax=Jeotgalibacillus soli TaxID=889306 RepID=A0A0C2VYC6_9BACL|nr:hypothetical protein [Jeotgalibacillus soli]KIL49416.1 hypothetical protein KP78_08840 [Jeotgalibacillus soli]
MEHLTYTDYFMGDDQSVMMDERQFPYYYPYPRPRPRPYFPYYPFYQPRPYYPRPYPWHGYGGVYWQ